MNFEIVRIDRGPEALGFAIHRLEDGMWYLYGFESEEAAERLVYILDTVQRRWVEHPSLVMFSLAASLAASLEETA